MVNKRGMRLLKGTIGIGWLLGFMASLPAIQEARGKPDEHYCFCIIIKSSLSTQLVAVVLLMMEICFCAIYYWLLEANKNSQAQFSIHTVTHSLDARYSLVETIKTTKVLLPTGICHITEETVNAISFTGFSGS